MHTVFLGILQHVSPPLQLLQLNGTAVLNVNIQRYYSYNNSSIGLAWYHNNTRITSNERINITDGGTTLTIADTVETDAGKYQVRIDSMNFSSGEDPPECHKNLLPLLENLALHAPATFILQQSVTASCNPEDIITQSIIPDYHGHIDYYQINNTINFNASAIMRYPNVYQQLFKNYKKFENVYIYTSSVYDDKVEILIEIEYNNSEDLLGDYMVLGSFLTVDVYYAVCPGYYDYINNVWLFLISYFYQIISIKTSKYLMQK